MTEPKITGFGAAAIQLIWSPIIDHELHDEVLRYEAYLNQYFKADIIETVSTYHAIAVYLQPNSDIEALLTSFKKIEPDVDPKIAKNRYLWEIPVCYEPDFGWDLNEIATHSGLSIESIIQGHSKAHYRIYFTGFLPGFLYLGGLPEKLHTPRKAVPRMKIPKGAVAIGGNQTGIYPTESPGGWQIIGQTPIPLFDCKLQPPTPFLPGDHIKFKSIDLETFKQITSNVENKTYSFTKSKIA